MGVVLQNPARRQKERSRRKEGKIHPVKKISGLFARLARGDPKNKASPGWGGRGERFNEKEKKGGKGSHQEGEKPVDLGFNFGGDRGLYLKLQKVSNSKGRGDYTGANQWETTKRESGIFLGRDPKRRIVKQNHSREKIVEDIH